MSPRTVKLFGGAVWHAIAKEDRFTFTTACGVTESVGGQVFHAGNATCKRCAAAKLPTPSPAPAGETDDA